MRVLDTLCLITLIVIALTTEMSTAGHTPKLPTTPAGGFTSKAEVAGYLTELRWYFSVMGRPR